jgi:hypothetical protein
MREVDRKGWIYLMDREGESLVGDCWNRVIDQVLEHLQPYEELSSILDVMKADETFSHYGKKIRSLLSDKAETLEANFWTWATGPKTCDFEVLFLLEVLLTFEINRIYKFWYGSDPPFPFEKCEKALRRLEAGGGEDELATRIRAYARKFPPPPDKKGQEAVET